MDDVAGILDPHGKAHAAGREMAGALDRGGQRGMGHAGRLLDQGPDLATLNRSELDKLARELDIKGRSKMTRDELADAVAAARKKAGAA